MYIYTHIYMHVSAPERVMYVQYWKKKKKIGASATTIKPAFKQFLHK
jgi:hypothetical protein